LERKESGWWRGELNGASGLFPSNYIETIGEDSDDEDEAQQYDSGVSATLDEVVALYPYKASGTRCHSRRSIWLIVSQAPVSCHSARTSGYQ
jgi:hypothetical protein